MNNFKKSIFFALTCTLCLTAGRANALGDQWYIGIGGGSAWLQPNPTGSGVDAKEDPVAGGSLFFGLDIDDRSSGQLTLYSLGEAELENEELIPFAAVDGSILYRFYDTKDARLTRGGMSLALYGRFALGYMNRDTEIELSNDSAVYFGAGAGAELFLTNNFSMRVEGMYHDQDAASASLQLVGRFGGARRGSARPIRPEAPQTPQPPTPAPVAPVVPVPAVPVPVPAPVPVVPATPNAADSDGDKVPNAQDRCPGSRIGYPVRSTGCALFDGVLSGVSFAQGGAQLQPGSTDQLDFLANVLAQYPQAKVELHSHTDDRGSVREQAILTRARLRSIGTYLVSKGVRSNRLVLRSFGGTRPLYDNATTQGRDGNNRIEVIENSN